MMKKCIILLMIGLNLLSYSCYEPIPGSGRVVDDERPLSIFNSIEHNGIGKVYVKSGAPQKIVVTTDDNFLLSVKTIIKNDKLIISTAKHINPSKLEIYITIEDLSEIKLGGSGVIIMENDFSQNGVLWITNSGSGNIQFKRFNFTETEISGSGSGNIYILSAVLNDAANITNTGRGKITADSILAQNVNCVLRGSGNININDGFADTSKVNNNGSGNVQIEGISTNNSISTLNGSGNIFITVLQNLDAKINGSGSIYYWGSPVVTLDKKGTGNLVKKN